VQTFKITETKSHLNAQNRFCVIDKTSAEMERLHLMSVLHLQAFSLYAWGEFSRRMGRSQKCKKKKEKKEMKSFSNLVLLPIS